MADDAAAQFAVVGRHIELLQLAQDCARLGARRRTVRLLTGLGARDLAGLFAGERPRGRFPNSAEWMHDANLIVQVEASMFAALFGAALDHGAAPGRALEKAYRMYAGACAGPPLLNFDRAFDLACQVRGLWLHCTPTMTLLRCDLCHAYSLSAPGDMRCGGAGCVFCKLVRRYPGDWRLQRHFVARPSPALPPSVAALHQLLF